MPRFDPSTNLSGFLDSQSRANVPAWFPFPSFDPTDYAACGIFSLHHALLFLGQADAISYTKRLAPSIINLAFSGLDSGELRKLVRGVGCRAEILEHTDPKRLRRFVDVHLRKGFPVILGSDPAAHWCCVGGRSHDGFYVMADSAECPAVQAWEWESICEWVGDGDSPFEALAIVPGRRMATSRAIIPRVDEIWEDWHDDPWLADQWPNLLCDMLEVFWDTIPRRRGTPAGVFLDEHSEALCEATADLSDCKRRDADEWLDVYRSAADLHALVVRHGDEDVTFACLSIVLDARLRFEA